MSDSYVGEIRMFAGNYAPYQWAICNGQLISIQQNTPLFALIGTIYGGNGTTTFALPDLRGRAPVHQGQGPDLEDYPMGDQGGLDSVTLVTTQMPGHTHALQIAGTGNQASPQSSKLAISSARDFRYSTSATNTSMAQAIQAAGGSQAHENRSPYVTLNFIICLQGNFPSRN